MTRADYEKDWRARHRESQREYFKQYYFNHRAARLQANKERYDENKERYLAVQRERYRLNREKILEQQRGYFKAHSAAAVRRAKAYAQKHPERVRAYKKKWAESHRHEGLMKAKARRARLKVQGHQKQWVSDFYKRVRASDWIKCYYCGGRVKGKLAHIDHVVAVSKGGEHASENLAASCAKCNLNKSDHSLTEWNPFPQQILPL